MKPDVYWIDPIAPHRLAIMPRPRAGEWLADEIIGYRRMGVVVIVSLLEAHEVEELGLGAEAALCEQSGVVFISHPIADRGVPASPEAIRRLSATLATILRDGKGVAIHCRAGIGRSSLLAACVMAELGTPPAQAFHQLSTARRVAVPDTPEQQDWVFRHARSPRIVE